VSNVDSTPSKRDVAHEVYVETLARGGVDAVCVAFCDALHATRPKSRRTYAIALIDLLVVRKDHRAILQSLATGDLLLLQADVAQIVRDASHAAHVEHLAEQGQYGARVGYGSGWKRSVSGSMYWGKGQLTSRGMAGGPVARAKPSRTTDDVTSRDLPWQITPTIIEAHLVAGTLPVDPRARAIVIALDGARRAGPMAPATVVTDRQTLADLDDLRKASETCERAGREAPVLRQALAALTVERVGNAARAALATAETVGALTTTDARLTPARKVRPDAALAVLVRAFAGSVGRKPTRDETRSLQAAVARLPGYIAGTRQPVTLDARLVAQAIEIATR